MTHIIFFILLVIIIILILYYDFYRFLKIHYDDDNNYILNYKYKPKIIKNKIILSLTSTPYRIKYIKPVIKSLLCQSIRVEQITLNITEQCKKDIPENFNNMANIYTCNDYGKGTKFIPTIFRENDKNTIIILLDDSYIYGYDFIETLIEKHIKYPNNVIYTKEAILFKPNFVNINIIQTNKKKIMIQCPELRTLQLKCSFANNITTDNCVMNEIPS